MLKLGFSPTVARNGLKLKSALQPVRLLSSSRFLLNEDGNKNVSKKNESSDFNVRFLGVASDIYVPPPFKTLPNAFAHPIDFFNMLIRKIYVFGLNSVQVALFRNQSKIKPKFVLWKNNAIKCYINVNTAFARKEIEDYRGSMNIWVQEALELRQKKVSRNLKLDWKLQKFNDVPKLVSVQSMMLPGRPLEHIQLVYRFDTKQRLIKIDKKSGETDTMVRDVVDYIVFLCDATTDEMVMVGSVFESEPRDKLPKNYETDQKVALAKMRKCGDIFRIKESEIA